jgi:dCTP deaminase
MGFWSTEKFKIRASQSNIIDDYSAENVKHGAYELAVGAEAFLTSSPEETKKSLEAGETFVIPPGQFAILLTEEAVRIPTNAIGFISVRFSVKRRGLINVSGFHVDPGYRYRLKFAVYNAGSQAITLHRGKRIFLLWLADLDRETSDVYHRSEGDHGTITDRDQDDLRGVVSSPAQLRQEVDDLKKVDFADLKQKFESHRVLYAVLVTLIGALFTRLAFLPMSLLWPMEASPRQLEALKREIVAELRSDAMGNLAGADPPLPSIAPVNPDSANGTSDDAPSKEPLE